jgi:hypothetical protein
MEGILESRKNKIAETAFGMEAQYINQIPENHSLYYTWNHKSIVIKTCVFLWNIYFKQKFTIQKDIHFDLVEFG